MTKYNFFLKSKTNESVSYFYTLLGRSNLIVHVKPHSDWSTWRIYFSNVSDPVALTVVYFFKHVVGAWLADGHHVPSCGSIDLPHK